VKGMQATVSSQNFLHVMRMHSHDRYGLVVLQNLTDSEEVRGLCGEIYPASSHDAYHPISIQAGEISDAEEEEDIVPITFPEIMVEPEVSCVSVCPVLGRFHKYRDVVLRTLDLLVRTSAAVNNLHS
jgi:hypothetical protein